MKPTFEDKHVVTTGGSSGLRLALAKRLILVVAGRLRLAEFVTCRAFFAQWLTAR